MLTRGYIARYKSFQARLKEAFEGNPMKQREIERKFLVKNDGWRGKAPGVPYRQGYIARTANRTVRIRIAGKNGVLNIKYREKGIVRHEFEYNIPLEEAEDLLSGLNYEEIIEKKRYTFEEQGNIWEVDEFEGMNRGLVVAEIELSSEDQSFVKPPWLGEEVSSISRYFNVELAKMPYTTWPKELKKHGN